MGKKHLIIITKNYYHSENLKCTRLLQFPVLIFEILTLPQVNSCTTREDVPSNFQIFVPTSINVTQPINHLSHSSLNLSKNCVSNSSIQTTLNSNNPKL